MQNFIFVESLFCINILKIRFQLIDCILIKRDFTMFSKLNIIVFALCSKVIFYILNNLKFHASQQNTVISDITLLLRNTQYIFFSTNVIDLSTSVVFVRVKISSSQKYLSFTETSL